MNKLYGVPIECPNCHQEMYFDDIVKGYFKGNQNEYYCCGKCDATATVRVRDSKVSSIIYTINGIATEEYYE